jgi:hypothetical protein
VLTAAVPLVHHLNHCSNYYYAIFGLTKDRHSQQVARAYVHLRRE